MKRDCESFWRRLADFGNEGTRIGTDKRFGVVGMMRLSLLFGLFGGFIVGGIYLGGELRCCLISFISGVLFGGALYLINYDILRYPRCLMETRLMETRHHGNYCNLHSQDLIRNYARCYTGSENRI